MGQPARVLEFKKKPAFGDMLKQTAKAKEPAKSKSKMPVLAAPKEIGREFAKKNRRDLSAHF